jgi:hypothetical protein
MVDEGVDGKHFDGIDILIFVEMDIFEVFIFVVEYF